MIKSIDDIVMVVGFPIKTYGKKRLDKLSNDKLMILAHNDEECAVWDIFEFEDCLNSNAIDTNAYWIKILR